MHSSTQLLTLVAAASSAAATFQGFNYDAKVDGRGKTQEEFAREFSVAANLKGTNGGFTSARLFTTVVRWLLPQPISHAYITRLDSKSAPPTNPSLPSPLPSSPRLACCSVSGALLARTSSTTR